MSSTMPPPTSDGTVAGFLFNSGPPPPPKQHFRGYTPAVYNGKPTMNQEEYDGKRLRKSSMRKTVDYNSSIMKYLEDRVWQRGAQDRPALQPDVLFYPELVPPSGLTDNPINAVTTRFVRTATNKMRCPIFCLGWTPEGRRLITGASSGEFTLWNGLTFNFETILQAHDSPVRTMVWSRNDQWMVTGDHGGYIKYWQMNMNNVKMFQAHKDPLRGISFSPSDHKLATCSDDGTVRIWDFNRCYEEKVLRGHGADVKCCDWHPHKGLVVSGSKDNQQPVRLWDPKSGQSLATLHAHKSTVMDLSFNRNGNWLLTASRDHLIKLFDIRNLGQELQTFRGHKKEAASVKWHPVHETLFVSGGSDGALMFWNVGCDKEVGCIEQAHDSLIWSMSWHPLGHVLASGSNDHTTKFWTRNRPGDTMQDKYNLNIGDGSEGAAAPVTVGRPGHEEPSTADAAAVPAPGTATKPEAPVIPGMGPDDRVDPPASASDREGSEEGGSEAPPPRGPPGPMHRFAPRAPHWRFANHWNERWGEEAGSNDRDRGGRGGWRGRGRGEWRGRGRGGFRDREEHGEDKAGEPGGDGRGPWSDRGGHRPDSREDGDEQTARDMDMRPGGGEGRGFRGGSRARRGGFDGAGPGRGRGRTEPGDWGRAEEEDADLGGGRPTDSNGHQNGAPTEGRQEAGFRGSFRGGFRGDRGGFRGEDGGGFREGERGGFRGRGGGGFREGGRGNFGPPRLERGGFGNSADRDGFNAPGARGGFGSSAGRRGGFASSEGERGGFGPSEADRGEFGSLGHESSDHRGTEELPGGNDRFDAERSNFRRMENDRDGFGGPPGDQGGFGRANGDRGGFGARPGGGRSGGLLERPDVPRGEWRGPGPEEGSRRGGASDEGGRRGGGPGEGGWRGAGPDDGSRRGGGSGEAAWRGGGPDEGGRRGGGSGEAAWRGGGPDEGGRRGGGPGEGGWRGGGPDDGSRRGGGSGEAAWRGGGAGAGFRGRGGFREDERGGWRGGGRGRGRGPPARGRGRGEFY